MLVSRNLQFFAHAELKPTFNEWLDHPALQTRSLNVRERERDRSIRAHWSMSGLGRSRHSLQRSLMTASARTPNIWRIATHVRNAR